MNNIPVLRACDRLNLFGNPDTFYQWELYARRKYFTHTVFLAKQVKLKV